MESLQLADNEKIFERLCRSGLPQLMAWIACNTPIMKKTSNSDPPLPIKERHAVAGLAAAAGSVERRGLRPLRVGGLVFGLPHLLLETLVGLGQSCVGIDAVVVGPVD